jgi:ankyrin repeat protein
MRTIIAAGHSRDRFDPETNDSAGFHKVVSGGSVRSGILGMLSHNRFIKGLELMMSKGANMNSTQHLETPLIIAINDGDQRCQFALIESGEADLGVSLYSGSTPLNQAIHKGDRALVKKLLAARADPNLCCTYNGHSALFSAYNSDDSIVRSLLKYGADPSSKDRHNAPALMMHIQSDRSDSLLGEMLNTPSVKADSSFLNDPISLNGVATGDRLLTVATHSNRPNLIKMLIMAGADVNIPNNKGCTPLVVACQFNFVSAAKVLIESGANVDQQDCHGEPGLADKMSCVHFAVCSGHEELLRLLIASGANLHIANSAGTTPLEFASHVLQSGNTTIRKGLNTCVALLKEAHLK